MPLSRFRPFALSCFLLLAALPATAHEPPPPGTIFVTRNSEAVGNRRADAWNHVAMMGPNGWVIEGQEGRGVIAVPWRTFDRRYPTIVAARILPREQGDKLAAAAVAQLGRPYRLLTSNCVDVVVRAVGVVTGSRPTWARPDAVVAAASEILWTKDARQGWVESPDPFAGATTAAETVLGSKSVNRRDAETQRRSTE